MEYLQTERLTLRPPGLRDCAALCVHYADYDVVKFTARIPYPYRLRHAEDFIGHAERELAAGTGYYFAVCRSNDDYCIGGAGLRRDAGNGKGRFELGYALGRPYWGFGFATEAARALVAYAFDTLKAEHISADRFADNPVSARVLEKLGFRETGPDTAFSEARRERVAIVRTEITRDAFAARML